VAVRSDLPASCERGTTEDGNHGARPSGRLCKPHAIRNALGRAVELVALERAGTTWENALPAGAGEQAVVLPSIVYAELMSGVRLADTPERGAQRRAKIDALADRVPIVDLGREIASRWPSCSRVSALG
jgi:hypothetical protein